MPKKSSISFDATSLTYNMVYMNADGEFIDSELPAAVRSGNEFLITHDFIPLPEGSSLIYLPGRLPVAYVDEEFLSVESPDEDIYPLCALLPAGYTRLFLPAYENSADAPILPLFGYAAVAIKDGEFFVAAKRTDDPVKWNPLNYPQDKLEEGVSYLKEEMPENRLVEHLAHCALEYHCLTASNIFLNRWEGGIPTSPTCNAGCLGCISLQESECCPSPQERIAFRPTPEEIAEIAIYHLEKGDEPIISFGQGCEGEPLLASSTIKKAIEKIRMTTKKGIINMNTNAFSKDRLLSLREAGLDSIRISMISNIEETYNLYHNPCGYSLNDVRTAGRAAKSAGLFISLNLLTIPGLNDTPTELRAWEELLAEGWVDLVQIRNLNIDPDWLFAKIPLKEKGLGILHFIDAISKYTKVGNFSHYELKK